MSSAATASPASPASSLRVPPLPDPASTNRTEITIAPPRPSATPSTSTSNSPSSANSNSPFSSSLASSTSSSSSTSSPSSPVPVPPAKKITLDAFGNEIKNDPETGYYEEIEIEDMEFDADQKVYTYPCPCGDKFRITVEELMDGEEIAKCPTCTLVIKVIYDPEDFENEEEDDGY